MNIAIAGCGIAGATAAFLLAEGGCHVTVFEQAAKCGPVGAGILLQPSGQAVLESLGLLNAVRKSAARIDSLHAVQRSGKELVRVPYHLLGEHVHGLGVHRGELFSLLHQRCLASGVNIVNARAVHSYEQDAHRVRPLDEDRSALGEFDLLLVADGSRSRLRSTSPIRHRVREYDYAALWTTGTSTAVADTLLQVVEGTRRMIGLLPIGGDRCSFFWGLHKSERDGLFSRGLDCWKRECSQFSDVASDVVSPIRTFDEVTFATYRDVTMKRSVDGRVVFLGDAAHASSPHLGQGVNLALEDAICLAKHLLAARDRSRESLWAAAKRYERERRPTWRFYSGLTRLLTPFFQSDHRILGWGRDCVLPRLPAVPFFAKQMALTMAGLKQGLLGTARTRC